MSRRIIPVLCALAVAVVPATALAQPAQDPSPAVTHGGVVYGDTKYDLQNQQDQKSPTGVSAYDQAISGDTKGNLPRAIAPAGTPAETPRADHADAARRVYGTTKPPTPWPDASRQHDQRLADRRPGRGGRPRGLRARRAALVARRQHRAPHMGV